MTKCLVVNIGGYVVHIRNPIDGSWVKVHEKDFSKAIIVVKNCCIKVAQTLISKLNGGF